MLCLALDDVIGALQHDIRTSLKNRLNVICQLFISLGGETISTAKSISILIRGCADVELKGNVSLRCFVYSQQSTKAVLRDVDIVKGISIIWIQIECYIICKS